MAQPEDDEPLRAGATYRGIAEQRLTAAEERFERARRTTGLFLGPLALLVVLLLPLGLPAPQHRLAAILAFVITYWITEAIPIPVTGLIGVALCAFLQVGSARDVMAGVGDPAVFLYIGA